jgi:hypothetical protein
MFLRTVDKPRITRRHDGLAERPDNPSKPTASEMLSAAPDLVLASGSLSGSCSHPSATGRKADAQRTNDKDRLQTWAGQSAAMARAEPAGEIVRRIWDEANALLP